MLSTWHPRVTVVLFINFQRAELCKHQLTYDTRDVKLLTTFLILKISCYLLKAALMII